MKAFMDEDFLLSTPTARKLFHDYAENTPVLDYHCHINPKEIAQDRISGVLCAPAEWTSATSPAMPVTRKNS